VERVGKRFRIESARFRQQRSAGHGTGGSAIAAIAPNARLVDIRLPGRPGREWEALLAGFRFALECGFLCST
jgi:hypothetical protein